MGRILSIDYGRKRCGLAVTDPLQIVANGLTTIATASLSTFVKEYMAHESVELIIVGYPTTVRGEESESMRYIRPGIRRLQTEIGNAVPVRFFDERFTSVLAHKAMLDGGLKKMERRNKALVDEISATIILNDYLQSRQFPGCNPLADI